MPSSPRTLRRFAPLGRAVWMWSSILLLLCWGAAPASAEPAPEPSASPGTAPEIPESPPSIAEYYADLLEQEPEGAAVVVDELVGGLGETGELAEQLEELFGSLDVPYYVVVTPLPEGTANDRLAASVADRIGEDGLYVHLRARGRHHDMSVSRGAGVDTEEVERGLFDDPRLAHDSHPLETAASYVEQLGGTVPDGILGGPGEQPPSSVLEARWEAFLSGFDPNDRSGPENLGVLAGTLSFLVLIGGSTLAVLLVRRARSTGRSGGAVGGAVAAGTLALAVTAVVLPHRYLVAVPDDGRYEPTEEDLVRRSAPYVANTERVDRLLAETGSAPVHVDPLFDLPRAGLDRVAERLEETDLPVRALLLPMNEADESGGDPEVLAYALAARSDADQAVYLVLKNDFDSRVRMGAAATGLGIDAYDLSEVGYGSMGTSDDGDLSPDQALEGALDVLEEAHTDPGAPDATPFFAEDRSHEPGPRVPRFWSTFAIGAVLLAPMIAGALAGAAVLARWLMLGHGPIGSRMGHRALRSRAHREVRALSTVLGSVEGERQPLRDADSALLLFRHAEEDIDLLGVAVLARRARLALLAGPGEDTAYPRTPCMVNPLHEHAKGRSRIHGFPDKQPVCSACLDTGAEGRGTRLLRLRRDGRWVPHLQLDHPWVSSRYASTSRSVLNQFLEKIGV